MRRVRLGAALAVLLLTAGGIVAAVTQGDDDASVSSRPVADEMAVDESANAMTASGDAAALSSRSVGGGSSGAAGAQSAPPASAPDGPRIVKRADLRIEVKADGFRAAFQKASTVASAHGGFVANSTSQTDEESASGTLMLRVPAASFDAVRTELAGLGEVDGEVVSGEDVGGQLVDLDARIRSLQVEEETLRTLMGKAKTVGETVEVQQHLTRVRQEIEQAAGQRARLQDAAALATITVNLFEPGAEPAEKPGEPNPVAEGARDAVDASLAVFGGTLLVLGFVLPVALLALLGWALWRLATRRTRPTPIPST